MLQRIRRIRYVPFRFRFCGLTLPLCGWVLWVNAYLRACPADMGVPLSDCPITAQASNPAVPFTIVGTYDSQALCDATAAQHARQMARLATQQRRDARERVEGGRIVMEPRPAQVYDHRSWCLPEGTPPTLPP